MQAQYIEVETVNEIKPITQVHFNSDYDITEICTRFGNWSRLGLYLKQNTPSYYHSQPKKLKNICSDEDAELINKAFLEILRLNVINSKNIYDVLILFYFGEKQIITDLIPTDGYVRKEIARLSQGIQGAPNLKRTNKGIRIDEIYVVKPLSIKAISDKLGITWDKASEYKKSGEDFLHGYFSAMANVGFKLDLMFNIKNLK